MKLDFDSPENREKSLLDFKSLLDNPGWKLMEAIVNENIKVIKEQIIDGEGEGETVDSINRLRDKLRAYKDVINTPTFWIGKLSPVEDSEENNYDPYDK